MIFDLVGLSNGSNQARDTPSYGNRCININMDLKEVSMQSKNASNKAADTNSTLDPEADVDFGDSFGNG